MTNDDHADDLLELLQNASADKDEHLAALDQLETMLENLDPGRVVQALMVLFNGTADAGLRQRTSYLLASLGRETAQRLLPHACARGEDETVRLNILNALSGVTDPAAIDPLRAVIFDESDSILVRCAVIEWIWPFTSEDYLEPALQLLANPSPDIRFWTLFSLTNEARYAAVDPRLLAALDQIAAYDHALPLYWNWHNDREAFEALADLHYHPYRQPLEDEDEHPEYVSLYLLSPAAEYIRFSRRYRSQTPDGQGIIEPQPPVETKIEADWLRERIQTEWPSARFDVIPAPREVYLLDWLIEIDGQTLLGGLHRDQYAVLLKGADEIAYQFIDWYRSIRPEKSLYVYNWADDGIELKPGETMAKFE